MMAFEPSPDRAGRLRPDASLDAGADDRPGLPGRRTPAPGAAGEEPTADAPAPPPTALVSAGPGSSAPAFDAVIAAHEVELYRYLRRLSPTADDAADLHQETFLRAFRAYGDLPSGANVRAWLYRIAGNLARDAHRRRRVRGAMSPLPAPIAAARGDGDPPEPIAGSWSDPAARAATAELRDAVRDALLSLGLRQRAAVIARVLEGAPYDEVASILDCSQELARQHVSQGLRRMRARLIDRLEVRA